MFAPSRWQCFTFLSFFLAYLLRPVLDLWKPWLNFPSELKRLIGSYFQSVILLKRKDDLYVTSPGASMCWSSIAPRADTTSSPSGPITLERCFKHGVSVFLYVGFYWSHHQPSHQANCTSRAILPDSFHASQTAPHSSPPEAMHCDVLIGYY